MSDAFVGTVGTSVDDQNLTIEDLTQEDQTLWFRSAEYFAERRSSEEINVLTSKQAAFITGLLADLALTRFSAYWGTIDGPDDQVIEKLVRAAESGVSIEIVLDRQFDSENKLAEALGEFSGVSVETLKPEHTRNWVEAEFNPHFTVVDSKFYFYHLRLPDPKCNGLACFGDPAFAKKLAELFRSRPK